MKYCKLDTCQKELTGGRSKFCCDAHANKFYQNKLKLERRKEKQLNEIVRHCNYEKCGKELPKDAHAQKKYCLDTDCYKKQNALDSKKYRERIKANKKEKVVFCHNDECKKKIDKPSNGQKYCDRKCRNKQNKIDVAERHALENAQYELAKEKAREEHGTAKEIFISPDLLGKRLPREKRKKVKFEIKHFSAQWLEDAWNNRETA